MQLQLQLSAGGVVGGGVVGDGVVGDGVVGCGVVGCDGGTELASDRCGDGVVGSSITLSSVHMFGGIEKKKTRMDINQAIVVKHARYM